MPNIKHPTTIATISSTSIQKNHIPLQIQNNQYTMPQFINASFQCSTSTVNDKSQQNTSTSAVGYLELIIGPMYSGKTSTIIELNKQYALSNMRVCIINYAEDKRYDENMLSTHDKRMIECYNTLNLCDLLYEKNTDTSSLIEDHDVFLINEGQFFPDLFDSVKMLVEEKNKIVHICGLDGDFQRNGFEQIIRLIPYADTITKKYSICKGCQNGTRALFSHRLSGEKEVKVIGAENYVPLCRKCYLEHTHTEKDDHT